MFLTRWQTKPVETTEKREEPSEKKTKKHVKVDQAKVAGQGNSTRDRLTRDFRLEILTVLLPSAEPRANFILEFGFWLLPLHARPRWHWIEIVFTKFV